LADDVPQCVGQTPTASSTKRPTGKSEAR
jgi:hypothetical protein